jgi:thiol-disulfide isomerase/thioredoxin
MTGSTGSLRLFVIALVLAAATAGAADLRTVSHGSEVELTDHLVAGKLVLFDFYADWCGPCRGLEPRLAELAERHADRLALRKIDIVNWDSPVARQHRIGSIPHLVLYGPGGERLAAGDAGSVLGRLAAELGDGDAAPSSGSGVTAPLLGLAAIAAATIALLVRRRRPGAAPEPRPAARIRPTPVDTAADPGDLVRPPPGKPRRPLHPLAARRAPPPRCARPQRARPPSRRSRLVEPRTCPRLTVLAPSAACPPRARGCSPVSAPASPSRRPGSAPATCSPPCSPAPTSA